MKLTSKALIAINNPTVRVLIAGALRCTEQTIMRYIAVNSEQLTLAAALEVIRQQTKMNDKEILERETISA